MKKIVNKLIKNNETISTMESCTGGMLASEITNVSGSSEILKFSAVTYSNEYKIKMGVSSKTINKYSVYSMEVAREMSKCISDFTLSTYGVGITGKLGRVDINNLYGDNKVVYFSIYNRKNNRYYTNEIQVSGKTRKSNKMEVVNEIKKMLNEILDI